MLSLLAGAAVNGITVMIDDINKEILFMGEYMYVD